MTTEWADDEWPAEWADDDRAEWLEKWAPKCPLRNPQRLCTCLGYREREPRRLQLRVVLAPGTEGICESIVDEHENAVYVRVIACYEENDNVRRDDEYLNCPVHVYLEKPLDGRAVIDVDTDKELPLFTPDW